MCSNTSTWLDGLIQMITLMKHKHMTANQSQQIAAIQLVKIPGHETMMPAVQLKQQACCVHSGAGLSNSCSAASH
jgi:hypothetical protein